jgi:spore coat polysaccharide biosynthesis protein SpsF (cytidylyltransferase family)
MNINDFRVDIEKLSPKKDDIVVIKLKGDNGFITEEDVDALVDVVKEFDTDCQWLVIPNSDVEIRVVKNNNLQDIVDAINA